MPTGTVIAKYCEWQDQLRDHGVTHVATDAFFELCKVIEENPFLDVQSFEAVLERLHVRAYPNASTRPPRLTAGDLPDLRE